MKLSDYVIQFIADQGVKHVFLVPGGGAMHLNDSLGRHPDLSYVSNLHEQASAIGAEAYSRVTGKLSAAMVTTGPGGTNALTGVAGAWLDSTPVLFVSGQVKRPDIKAGTGLRQLGVQEIDIVTIVDSITKYAITIMEPETIRYHLEKAVHLATTGRPGPVWIDIPLDVQACEVDPQLMQAFHVEGDLSDVGSDLSQEARRVLELLSSAERPVLLAGNGIRIAGALHLFEELKEKLQIPVLTTWLGLDLITDDDPLFAGRPGAIAPRAANFTLQNSDFFMSIGARLDMALTGYAHDRFARGAKKVIVDIDAAEIEKFQGAVEAPIEADAGLFIQALLDVLPEFTLPSITSWFGRIIEWKNRYPLAAPETSHAASDLSAYDFSTFLSDEIPEGALIVPGSSGFASEIFFLMLKIKKVQRCFHNRGTGSMGFAIPAALGACVASGGQTTVSVDGDGGFQFNIQELATIAALGLPIKFFVINNNGYSSIRSSQVGYFSGNLVACDPTSGLKLPDICAIASAFGIETDVIRKGDDVREKIRKSLSSPGPVVCEVKVIPDEPRMPRLASFKRADGSMASRPLEDLFPFLDRDEFRSNMLIPVLEETE